MGHRYYVATSSDPDDSGGSGQGPLVSYQCFWDPSHSGTFQRSANIRSGGLYSDAWSAADADTLPASYQTGQEEGSGPTWELAIIYRLGLIFDTTAILGTPVSALVTLIGNALGDLSTVHAPQVNAVAWAKSGGALAANVVGDYSLFGTTSLGGVSVPADINEATYVFRLTSVGAIVAGGYTMLGFRESSELVASAPPEGANWLKGFAVTGAALTVFATS